MIWTTIRATDSTESALPEDHLELLFERRFSGSWGTCRAP